MACRRYVSRSLIEELHSDRHMTLRIITWNVNSVRLRLDILKWLVAETAPDVICLQETKVQDGDFPRQAIAEMGFDHIHIQGMKSYNGVAILARVPFTETGSRSWCGRDDCRHIFVRLKGGIDLHNLYVPAGGDIPDPDANPKFAHKLQFLEDLTGWFAAQGDNQRRSVLVGDLNVAPLETDVWSHKQLLKIISHTPVEVELLNRLQQSLDWVDAVRHFIPPEQQLYSWWSYRAKDWRASNRGRRLDHIWVTPQLRSRLKDAKIVTEARDWSPTSDHAPVVVTL